jgi:hypothetical protein
MTHFTYITDHLLRAWVQQWSCNFRIWADLMTNNYDRYVLLEEDDPYQECYEWFWASINIDDILSKEFLEELYQMFLEELYQMIDDIESGKEKLIPMPADMLKRMEDLVDDMERDVTL